METVDFFWYCADHAKPTSSVTIDDGDGDLASAAATLHQMQQKTTSYKLLLYFMYAAQVCNNAWQNKGWPQDNVPLCYMALLKLYWQAQAQMGLLLTHGE